MKNNYYEIWLEVVNENNLTLDILSELHKQPQRAIKRGLDSGSGVDFRTCYELFRLCKRCNFFVSEELNNLVLEPAKQVSNLLYKHPEMRLKKKRRIFIFHGQERSIKEIADVLKLSKSAVLARIKKEGLLENYSDVTVIDKPKRLYTLNGITMNLNQISKKTGLSYVTLNNKIFAAGLRFLDSIDEIVKPNK